MGHLALYRQFRPLDFDEVVEQSHAVTTLRQSIISEQIGHAYLFCGTRGTGKTTLAKIFARGINCLSPKDGNPCNTCEICKGIMDSSILDVIEIDAASNNSVENIRRICDEVVFLPSRSKYKVYIIDEVHMLSNGAFNALLKTLEEPPQHAVFLLATTEPHRIPATILSRCQRYDLRRISSSSIVSHLRKIANEQKIQITTDALQAIANLSEGALRDAISLLDQAGTTASGEISRDDILQITGLVDDGFNLRMAEAILTGNAAQIITYTKQLMTDGRDIIHFSVHLAHIFRDLLVLSVCLNDTDLIQASDSDKSTMKKLAKITNAKELIEIISKISVLASDLKWTPDVKTTFEIALLGLCAGKTNASYVQSSEKAGTFLSKKSIDSPSVVATEPAKKSDVATIKDSSVHTTENSAVLVTEPVLQPVSEPILTPPPPSKEREFTSPPEVEFDFTPPPLMDSSHSTSKTISDDSPPVAEPISDTSTNSSNENAAIPPPLLPIDELSKPAGRAFSTDGVVRSTDNLIQQVLSDNPFSEFSENMPEITDLDAPPKIPEITDLEAPPEIPEISDSEASTKIPEISDSEAPPEMSESKQINMPMPESGNTNASKVITPFIYVPEKEIIEEEKEKESSDEESLNQTGIPLAESWRSLLEHWQDSLFIIYLQFQKATVYEKGDHLQLVFPNAMKEYVRTLTTTEDYKTVCSDILGKLPHIKRVALYTDTSFRKKSTGTGKKTDEISSKQVQWVKDMMTFAADSEIPVETPEKL